MTDNSFFESCINSFSNLYDDSDTAFIKDIDFHYRIATTSFTKLLVQTQDKKYIEGKTIAQILQFSEIETNIKIKQKILDFNMKVITQKQVHRHLTFAPEFSSKIFITKLKPLINPNTGNIVGILGSIEPMYSFNLPLFILKNNKKYYRDMKNHPLNLDTLTSQQNIVLLLLCNYLSMNEIRIILEALNINISMSRIKDIINELKNIFNAGSKEQLVELALRLNCHRRIPKQLFPDYLYEIEEYETIVVC